MTRIPRPNDISTQNILENAQRNFFSIRNPTSSVPHSQPDRPMPQKSLPQVFRSISHSPDSIHLHEHKHKHNHHSEDKEPHNTLEAPIPSPNPLSQHKQHQAFEDYHTHSQNIRSIPSKSMTSPFTTLTTYNPLTIRHNNHKTIPIPTSSF
eukprot:GHVP01057331.1.p1 GENE.GHVP01057331.1~~GHVP01057331.1.p1  ORF type:complete len:151 (-),score=6.14 GHVP01057331.1:228-680(-)